MSTPSVWTTSCFISFSVHSSLAKDFQNSKSNALRKVLFPAPPCPTKITLTSDECKRRSILSFNRLPSVFGNIFFSMLYISMLKPSFSVNDLPTYFVYSSFILFVLSPFVDCFFNCFITPVINFLSLPSFSLISGTRYSSAITFLSF